MADYTANVEGVSTVLDALRSADRPVENQRLKRIVADQALDIDGLKEVARGNW